MIIDCISDLHGFYPDVDFGDLLIICGDLTARDNPIEYGHFGSWMDRQKYRKKILIGGNHDNYLEIKGLDFIKDVYDSINVEYLCDSETEFAGLKIWGSPWTIKFAGMNPHCMAFTVDTEEELAEKWRLIPDDIDILVTHSPPYGILDKNALGKHCGSVSLRNAVLDGSYFKKFRYHIFGHIHEMGSHQLDLGITRFINASYVNEKYEPINKPVRIKIS